MTARGRIGERAAWLVGYYAIDAAIFVFVVCLGYAVWLATQSG